MDNQYRLANQSKSSYLLAHRFSTAFLLVCLSLACPVQNTFAQETIPNTTISTETISIVDGLASPSVRDVIQDSYGLIWLATGNGVQMYDGNSFRNYKNDMQDPGSLQNNNCYAIIEDNEHNIWVGNDFGLSKFNRKSRKFTNFNFSKKYYSSTSNEGIVLHLFHDAEGGIWFAAPQLGIFFLDSKTGDWKEIRAEVNGKTVMGRDLSISLAFASDNKGNKWVGTIREGLMFCAANDSIFRAAPFQNKNSTLFKNANTLITALYVDSTNTIWITTRTAIFKYYPETHSLKTIIDYGEDYVFLNSWNQIKPDIQGNIWITNNQREALKFDGISDSYESVKIQGNTDNRQIDGLMLTDFCQDRSGIFWMGTYGFGLLKYNPISKPFRFYMPVASDTLYPLIGPVFGLIESTVHPDLIYVSCMGSGFAEFNPKVQKFTSIPFKSQLGSSRGVVGGMLEERNGTLWLGTWGDGLIKMDANRQEIKRYNARDSVENPISGNFIRVIKKDSIHNLWIGTNTGLSIFNPSSEKFTRISDLNSRSFTKSTTNKVENLLHTDGVMGIIDKETDNKKDSIRIQITAPGKYLAVAVGEGITYMVDYGWIENARGDTIWSSSKYSDSYFAGGAVKNRMQLGWVNLEKGSYTLHYVTDDSHSYGMWNSTPPNLLSLYGIAIVSVTNSSLQTTLDEAITNIEKTQILSNVSISDIALGEKYAWISTLGGLNRLDLNTDSILIFQHDPENVNSLLNDKINGMYFESDTAIWLATDGGLDRFNSITKSFTHFSEEDGLPTNFISDIVPGDKGELWISTQNGLSQMVQSEGIDKITFVNYNSSDGIGNDNFSANAGLCTNAGVYFFGGNKGITAFEKVVANQVPPQIILTDLFIANKSVTDMGDASPLNDALINTKDIDLSYDENAISFEFTALHYSNPSKNQYAHKLEGYDTDWIYDNRNYAAYTNLDPGKYVFKIRASNAFGVWNKDGLTIHISIAAPWWRSGWAYAGYVLILALLIFGVDRFMRKRIADREREKNREKELAQAKEIEKAYHNLEVAHQELKSAQSQLVEQEKLASLGQLTAGIAHEIKNPLNFVINFSDLSIELIDEVLDEFKTKINEAQKEEVENNLNDIKANLLKINQHGTRADGIVKSMLQHSRGGSGKKEPTELNALVQEFTNLAFHGMRAGKNPMNVKLDFDLDEKVGQVNLISDDFSRVVLNLCNNAFDAMREKANAQNLNNDGVEYNPTLTVISRRMGDSVELSIADNGPGIPEEIRNKILQPFFTTKKGTDGTGLGLSITNDIVIAHGGDLKIDSDIGSGTRFTINLSTL